jgi:hypothetical protein
MVLDFHGLTLNARFLRSDGVVFDDFTIDKSRPATVRPELQVQRSSQEIRVSWPTSNPAYDLEAAPVVQTNAPWIPVTNAVEISGRRRFVTAPLEPTNRFFRLRSR